MKKSNFEKILHEFHPFKNENINPDSLTYGSGKKVWWQCSKNPEHEWEASPNNRSAGSGCPFCSGQRPSKENNLSLHPVAEEFHYERNAPLKPEYFTIFSAKKIWWKCSKDTSHEWESSIANRVSGNGCPYCSGRFSSEENNLSLHPASKEFYYEMNYPLTPEDFTLGSEKKVWWKCKKNHSWKARIADRTKQEKPTECPICCFKSYSKAEKEILKFVKNLREDAIGGVKPFGKYEADIWIPELKLAIEYNGLYWHSLLIKDENYHYNKWEHFRKNGAITLFLWENQDVEYIENLIIDAVNLNFQTPENSIYNCELPIPLNVDGEHLMSEIELIDDRYQICNSGKFLTKESLLCKKKEK